MMAEGFVEDSQELDGTDFASYILIFGHEGL
jgi:hypothetical protein